MDLTSTLAGLVQLLHQKQVDKEKAVKYLAYLLPLVKNPLNLDLLINEAAQASLLTTASETGFFIDAMTTAARQKQQITNPTVPYDEWLLRILGITATLEPLPAMCLASALLAALNMGQLGAGKPARVAEKVLVARANDINWSVPESELAVVPLAKAQWALPPAAQSALPLAALFLPTLRLVYHPSLVVETPPLRGPLFAEFGAYSRLLAACFRYVPWPQLLHGLETIDSFVRTAVARFTPELLDQYKALLFGVALQMEGLCSQLLHNRRLPAAVAARHMTLLFQPLAFVIEAVGGGFTVYEFVRGVSLDALLECGGPLVGDLTAELAAGWPQVDPSREVGRGRLIYTLETAEQLLPILHVDVVQLVVALAERYLSPLPPVDFTRPLLETAHSFMLRYLAHEASPLARARDPQAATAATVRYLSEANRLYPGVLNYSQLKTALDSVVTAMAPPNISPVALRQAVLMQLYDAAKLTMPGQELPSVDDEGPPTLRAARVGALIAAVPPLCGPLEFAEWLRRIDAMIPSAYNPLVARERQWLKEQLDNMVVNLDLSLSDIGIRYWFERGCHL